MERQIEGIILFVTPYQERHEILGVFTPEGKISLIRKWGLGKKSSPLSPLTRVEFFYETGKGEMGKIKESALKDPMLKLRADFDCLNAAMSLLRALQLTQEGEAPSEALYRLTLKMLAYLPESKDKKSVLSLFYLKLLLHEGLIPLETLDLEMAELAPLRSLSALDKKIYSNAFHDKVKRLFEESVA